ncbi:LamG domain-containing protein [Halorhabdus salina]|uniref:LamG domain-containing protein n=1 Tax=Halorhabdus salina TaxID=2750670 RepID=UPI0015EFBC2C|nr:LamG domain-containing protein [Halorhabdus salina]
MPFERDRRGATPVVGNLLLVAIVVVIGIVVATTAFTVLDVLGTPTAEASFEYEQSPVGIQLTPVALGTDVTIQLNGNTVATVDSDEAGRSVLLPTAPGDRITVLSRDEDRTVLVDERIDERSELGDFISYYTFESGSGSTLVDRSGNGNDGTLVGNSTWVDGALRFDGTNHVYVDNISAPGDVEEFTIAMTYTQRGPDSDQITQLVEHTWGNEEWFLETAADGNGNYRIDYAVGYPDNDGQLSTGSDYDYGDRHIVVGTYDGETFELYVDGTKVGSGTDSRSVDMGEMRIGRDFESSSQYFEGDISEFRLYYSAFDAEDVRRITDAME